MFSRPRWRSWLLVGYLVVAVAAMHAGLTGCAGGMDMSAAPHVAGVQVPGGPVAVSMPEHLPGHAGGPMCTSQLPRSTTFAAILLALLGFAAGVATLRSRTWLVRLRGRWREVDGPELSDLCVLRV